MQRLKEQRKGGLRYDESPVKTLVYGRCPDIEDCGGFGDRIIGISAALSLAMMLNRVFLLDWAGLEHYFASPFFDWTYDADVVETGRTSDFSSIYQRFWVGITDHIMSVNADNAVI